MFSWGVGGENSVGSGGLPTGCMKSPMPRKFKDSGAIYVIAGGEPKVVDPPLVEELVTK
jgi:hypothetical protein